MENAQTHNSQYHSSRSLSSEHVSTLSEKDIIMGVWGHKISPLVASELLHNLRNEQNNATRETA